MNTYSYYKKGQPTVQPSTALNKYIILAFKPNLFVFDDHYNLLATPSVYVNIIMYKHRLNK